MKIISTDWFKKNIFEEHIQFSIPQIEKFLLNNKIQLKTIRESIDSTADDGPGFLHGDLKSYQNASNKIAERLGFIIIDYLIKKEYKLQDTSYPDGPIRSVSYFPAGVTGETTSNNQEDLVGRPAYLKWQKHIKRIANQTGLQFINFLDSEESIEQSKTEPYKKSDIHGSKNF